MGRRHAIAYLALAERAAPELTPNRADDLARQARPGPGQHAARDQLGGAEGRVGDLRPSLLGRPLAVLPDTRASRSRRCGSQRRFSLCPPPIS